MSELKPTIIRLQVNDPNTQDSYNLILHNQRFNLIDLLSELDREEQFYLLDALEQARERQRTTAGDARAKRDPATHSQRRDPGRSDIQSHTRVGAFFPESRRQP